MLVGPLVAVLSFVCSVGNAPLAAVLWGGGISFAGVIAFIYADLIIIPLVRVYGRYYGWRVAGIVVGLMFGAMVVAALAVDGIFSALGLVPSTRPSIDSIVERGDRVELHGRPEHPLHARRGGAVRAHAEARRPRPGLRDDGRPRQGADGVERGGQDATSSAGRAAARSSRPLAASTIERDGRTYFFCGPGCRASFEAATAASAEAEAAS